MKKLLIIIFFVIFVLSCNSRQNIKDNLGNIYYGRDESIDFETGETNYYTNYLYVSKSGQHILYVNTNNEYNYGTVYKYIYDSNNQYVFHEGGSSIYGDSDDIGVSYGVIFSKNKLLFTRGFYDSSKIKEYKLLNKTDELYNFIEEEMGDSYYYSLEYEETNFVNGKEPYIKRFNDYKIVEKEEKKRLKSYSQLEKDFKNLNIIERNSYKFAVLYEDYQILSIACKIEEIMPIVTLLTDSQIDISYYYSEDGAPVTDEMKKLSIRFDKYYAYADFAKINNTELITVTECPVCHKDVYEIEEIAMEKYGRYYRKNDYRFKFNIYTKQYECPFCYTAYYSGFIDY